MTFDHLTAGMVFYFDEWDFILWREWSAKSLLSPHNGHLSLLPASVWLVMLEVFGLDQYRPYRWMGYTVHAVVAVGIFLLLKSRGLWLALLTTTVFAFMGAGWDNPMWPFQIGMMGSLAFGLFALVVFEKEVEKPVTTSALVGFSLLCAGGGVAILVGFVIGATLYRRWRSLGCLFVLAGGYLVWYLNYGQAQGGSSNLPKIPMYVSDSLFYSAAALGGRSLGFGGLIVGIIMMLTIRNWRKVLDDRVIVVSSVSAVVGWILTAWSRAQYNEPGASRYVYIGAAYVAIVLVRLLPRMDSRKVKAVALLLSLILIRTGWDHLTSGARFLVTASRPVRLELTVLEELRPLVQDAYKIDDRYAPQIFAGQYLRAVDKYGSSPRAPRSWFRTADEADKQGADRVAYQLLRIPASVVPRPSPSPCTNSLPMNPNQLIIKQSGSAVIEVLKPARLAWRRFADNVAEGTWTDLVSPGSYDIRIPPDSLPADIPWVIVADNEGSVLICN